MAQITKLRPLDKKRLSTKFNFIVQEGDNVKGFKTLKDVNKALGLSSRTGFKSSSFKGKPLRRK